MLNDAKADIKELENYIGFPIMRKEVILESNEPHDESFSYGLCQRFYGKGEELRNAIKKVTNIILKLTKVNTESRYIALFYSLLGDMYYIDSDFNKSINCFMKALSYNKADIANWFGLMFSLRSLGQIETFEEIIFNLNGVYVLWKNDCKNELSKDMLNELLKRVK